MIMNGAVEPIMVSFQQQYDGLRYCVAAIAVALASQLALTNSVVASSVVANPATATALEDSWGNLHPVPQHIAFQEGRVSVSGADGSYTGQVLVKGSIKTAWDVLTDYNRFAAFLPMVTESQLLKSDGNQRVFEQTNLIRLFPFSLKRRVVIATTETYPRQIFFKAIEGDVKSLQGVWRLQSTLSNQVLVTHQVTIDPGSSSSKGLFFSIYKSSLEDTLSAFRREIERRSTAENSTT
jgi:ribosome-associated toxin RatA of RatAB toxin-antitoxin module